MQDYYIYHSIFLLFMFILGSAFGSFLCCQARRLKLRQDKPSASPHKPSGPSSKKSQKSSSASSSLGSRSVCLKCGYRLKWYDNLPIISWLMLRGKCRKCHSRIGLAELLSELGLGLAFLLVARPFDLEAITVPSLLAFLFTLLLIVSLGFLAIYDGLYGELPSLCLFLSLVFSVIIVVLRQFNSYPTDSFSFEHLIPIALSVLILAGTYLLLYLVSRGKWVGDGDWILALIIALVLGDPWLALIALFLANLLASLIMLPVIKLSKKSKSTKIYLGPYLVASFAIVLSFSEFFISLINQSMV